VGIVNTVSGIVRNEHLGYVLGSFATRSLINPLLMSRESSRFLRHWLSGRRELPKPGLRFEHHCHSHFSDGARLADIVDFLLDDGVSVWSLTDHDNSNAFDSLRDGSYNLNDETANMRRYDLDFSYDGRFMEIHSGGKRVVLLRSIELWTDKGEIGIHGYSGKFPAKRLPLGEAIDRAKDMGGYVVINHPYFWEGIGYHGRDCVEFAVSRGAVAIEKNATEIPPQVYSAVQAELDAKDFGVSLVTSGDAHQLEMYGNSGLTFRENDYETALRLNGGNHADVVRSLVTEGTFETYFNYVTPRQFLSFFSF